MGATRSGRRRRQRFELARQCVCADVMAAVEERHAASQNDLEGRVMALQWVRHAQELFVEQPLREERRML